MSDKRRSLESFFDVNIPKPVEYLKRVKDNKKAISEVWEEIRREKVGARVSFAKQLKHEQISEASTCLTLLQQFFENQAKVSVGEKPDIWKFLGGQGYLAKARSVQADSGLTFEESVAAVCAFYTSPYFYELPLVDIAVRLSTDLVTRHDRIKTGDNQDVQLLSGVIPIAHYVVADKAMVDRCRRLRIGEKWKTAIFTTKGIDDLCGLIEKL